MALVTEPIALDKSLNTTEQTSRNLADVLAEELSAIITAIGGLNFINFEVVQELPTTGISTTTIYLVPSDDPQSGNTYDEYINLNGTVSGWEKIGSTDIDLSGYYTSAEVDALLADKADVSDIPTVNDGTLTIQQNGETKATFTANQSGNSTVNIETPTTDIQTAVDEFETYNGGILDSLKVALSPIQDLHGYDHPWVGGAGKNILDVEGREITTDSSQQDYTHIFVEGGTATKNGSAITAVASDTWSKLRLKFDTTKLTDGSNYTLSATFSNPSNNAITVGYYDTAWHTLPNSTQSNIRLSITFAYSSEMSQLILGLMFNNSATVPPTPVIISDIQFEKSSSATSYEPYSNICPISGHTQVDVDVSDGQTTQEQVTVNLGGTYYSGVLDVVSGMMNVLSVGVDLGSLNTWEKHTESPYWFRVSLPYNMKSGWSEVIDGICEIYKASSGNSVYTASVDCAFGGFDTTLYIYDSTKVTLDATSFKSAMNGVKMVYALATPQTIQLSPTMVKALVGENHLSAPLEGQEITESKYKKMFTFDDVIAYIQSIS